VIVGLGVNMADKFVEEKIAKIIANNTTYCSEDVTDIAQYIINFIEGYQGREIIKGEPGLY
jgi:hypothetical protein